jgi:hypothetical protein
MIQYNPGDMVRALPEQMIFNKISQKSIGYYAFFYDNDLFDQYGIVLEFKNNFATVRFANSFKYYVIRTNDLTYVV